VATERQAVEVKTSSSSAVRDTSRSDHDDVLNTCAYNTHTHHTQLNTAVHDFTLTVLNVQNFKKSATDLSVDNDKSSRSDMIERWEVST